MTRIFSAVLAFFLLMTVSACSATVSPTDMEASLTPLSAPTNESGFTDVPADAWYTDAVIWCQANGVMSGTSDITFSPDSALTRGMLATVLWRIEGSPVANYLMDFSDVAAGSSYAEAVRWASSERLMSGYGNGAFGVNDPVNRQQFAVILWRYAGSPVAETVETYADESDVASWAEEAVRWARANGVISGKPENRFDPEGDTTRAQAAVILHHYLNPTGTDTAKVLVAWFSATHTTEAAAKKIADYMHADLFEIVPEDPYTSEDLNYGDSSSRTTKEQNDPTCRPVISHAVEGMENYDIVFLGYPIWHGQAPRIIYTFLESYDFAGKTIVPFCTSHSSSIGSSAENLRSSCSGDANWVGGKRFAANAADTDLYEWIDSLNLPLTKEVSSMPYDGVYPQHDPYGTGVGVMPGRVVWYHDPQSVSWDGDGYWWEPEHFNEAVILKMVNDSIASLGGEDTAADGWSALFQAHNGGTAYRAGEKIAIKANINGSAVYDNDTSGKTRMSYTNPVLLKALLRSLVEEAGVAPSDITVYDVSRLFPDYMVELCTAGGLRGVSFVGRDNGVADESAPINWSHSFGGNVNYLPTCVTEAAYLINLANLKGHSYGITLCGKNHFGSFINGNAMRPPEGANLHQWLTRNEMGIYSPLVDLMANEQLGGKTVLYLLDALICATSEGASITAESAKWQQSPFDGGYTASVFVSQDPVAIDSVGADFLMNEPTVTSRNGALRDNPSVENYLHEAGLVSSAPSGTAYTNGNGGRINNLGVHEHWNNSVQKQYSRNLGKSEGIELIPLTPTK